MSRIAIVRALRTPIGKFFGSLSHVDAATMGDVVVRSVMEGIDVPVDELIFGCARQAGQGPNPARQIAQRAGLSGQCPGLGDETLAQTVNMACGSGLKSIILGVQAIALGRADAIVAGGVENMTQVPFYLKRMRTGYRLGNGKLIDGMYDDGFHCRLADQLMGRTAETLAEQYVLSRTDQDQFFRQHRTVAEHADRFVAIDADRHRLPGLALVGGAENHSGRAVDIAV